MRQFTGHIVGFLAGSLFYPFQVARTNLSKTENFFPYVVSRDTHHPMSNDSLFHLDVTTPPTQVVTTCMSVSRSGLLMGYPPCMPFYTGWADCLKQLRAKNQLKRGSSLLFRYYSGPQVLETERSDRLILPHPPEYRWGPCHPAGLLHVPLPQEARVVPSPPVVP